jgi:hypothetical protein
MKKNENALLEIYYSKEEFLVGVLFAPRLWEGIKKTAKGTEIIAGGTCRSKRVRSILY